MGAGIRTGIAALLAAATLVAAQPAQATAAVATTTLSMGGTFNPLSVPPQPSDWVGYYIDTMADKYVRDTGLCAAECTRVGVYTPEQMGWLSGLTTLSFDASVAAGMANLDKCVRNTACVATAPPYTHTTTTTLTDSGYVVFGYSQSGTIASNEKAALIADPTSATVSFVMFANPNRPNGGILARVPGLYIPFLGVTFNGATPTDSPQSAPLTTVDVVGQYDLMSDAPTNPVNLLAMINAVAGYHFVHRQPLSIGAPELQGQYQDSTYYLIPTPTLPMLIPIAMVPLIGPLIAGVLDPPLRVLVETAYDRTLNPGAPTMANPLYFPNPVKVIGDFLTAIPTGWDNGIAYLTGDPANRPFGTTVQGVYGVGGPPVYAGAVDPYGPPTPYTPPVAPSAQIAAPTASTASSASARAPRRVPHSTGKRAGVTRPPSREDSRRESVSGRLRGSSVNERG